MENTQDDTSDYDHEDSINEDAADQPLDVSQKRRTQTAIFDSWLLTGAGKDVVKASTADSNGQAGREELSIKSLMQKHVPDIINSPRDYQIELFERAKTQNTIAVLDTGSGKTLIAVLLIRWIIDQELERISSGASPRITFFLVSSVALAYQQHSVLATNLDHNVAKVCGSDGPDDWQKDQWLRIFSSNRVIVCTPDILLRTLARSYISMSSINLLVFDEAHHAKKDHSYARIIKDFYLCEEDQAQRPRIFGMTASPIDARSDVVQAANELEALLCSKIATTIDMTLTYSFNRPVESTLQYDALPAHPVSTAMSQCLTARFGHLPLLQNIVKNAQEVGKELGSLCADIYVADVLSERNIRQLENSIQKFSYKNLITDDTKVLDNNLAELHSAMDLVKAYPQMEKQDGSDLSSKIRMLHQYLEREFERPSNRRCIVFVSKRRTARLLQTVFEKFRLPNMRSAFLVGSGSDGVNTDKVSTREQIMTVVKFRKGEINCLFATAVAEEGLDIPDCNLVIRFDLYGTMIQYVQSRGRARGKHSQFIHMVENGNLIQRHLVSEVRAAELAMRAFCQALPLDRRLVGNEDVLASLLSNEKQTRTHNVPRTGAKLTYGNALGILSNFVSAIPNENDEPLHATFVVVPRGSKFMAEAVLPSSAPIKSVSGREHTKKSLAKRAAAYSACLLLWEKGYLDDHLLPTYQRKLPAMRNALLAADLQKRNQYTMITKPAQWQRGRGNLPSLLWPTLVDFAAGLECSHCPLVLLTREPLPELPQFAIFLNDGSESIVKSRPSNVAMDIAESQLSLLTEFTFRVFLDVFSKQYENDGSSLSYWIAPACITWKDSPPEAPHDWLNWSILEEVSRNKEYKWSPELAPGFMVDKFVVDTGDGSRKFHVLNIEPDLKPTDPVPKNTVRYKWNENILAYSVSLFRKAREAATWDLSQPVLHVRKVVARRNMLAPPVAKEVTSSTRAYLCPEPLKISAIPFAVAASCFALPAVIYRFESTLIALEACQLVGVVCPPDVALAAVTKDADHGDQDTGDTTQFQVGMGENYERLEFIGDTFLKMATTISTFIQNPHDDEFEFHVKRMLLLCNKNLYEVATGLKLYEYVRSISFSRRLWYPEGLKLLAGKGAEKKTGAKPIEMHSLGQKTIADVSEALIGAAYMVHDKPDEIWHEKHWENAIRTVTKLVGSESHSMQEWNDYRIAYEKPAYQTAEPSASQRDLAEKVRLEHAYAFQYPRLLRSAFVHPSQPYVYERVPSYQRLEFLGDALLDMVSISYLFRRFPGKDPQWLTEHKMAMVSNKFLGAVCVNIGFHKHLRHSSADLEQQIRAYVEELSEARSSAEESRSCDYWTTVSDPPKCLPDMVEAYVGAMFIDSDFDYNTVRQFFHKHIRPYFVDMTVYDTYANNHPCTQLHNLLQSTYGCRDYRLMVRELPSADGVDAERNDVIAVVMIHDQIVSHSKGKSARYARIRVAHDAFEMIESMPLYQFRSKYRCDCHLKVHSEEVAEISADCTV